MNFTCCYGCTDRIQGCHSTCAKYAHYHELNLKEHEARKAYSASRFDVSLNRVCNEKLRRAAK